MQSVLFIGSDISLQEEFRMALQGSARFECVADVPSAIERLSTSESQVVAPVLALLDATGQADAPRLCQQLRQNRSHKSEARVAALIAIIDNPDSRQTVLQAGADDYLLLPLSTVEFNTRLMTHLRCMELALLQEETQIYAAQTALLALLSRLIGGRVDLRVILSQTLEQTVDLLHAWTAELWLWTADGAQLELTSSLSPTFSPQRPSRREIGQGLIGWVANQEKPLLLNVTPEEDRFDRQVDLLDGQEQYGMLAVPLKHQAGSVGVLAVYRQQPNGFTSSDVNLLEAIAILVASAIANAQAMRDLEGFAAQRHILYEMSQQIADGLDLQATIDRSLQWINRLCDVEASLLWLMDDEGQELSPIAALGVELDGSGRPELKLEDCLVDRIVGKSEIILINDPTHDPCECLTIFERLGIKRGNFLAIAMKHRRRVIGVITLLNRIGGGFQDKEIELLSTAAEMIGVSVSNARLHEQTLQLVQERERLHKLALQNERLATIGRLTASLAHEINNPMQAIRGALTLAQEEIHNPHELGDYLEIGLSEVNRVVNLVQRLRQIYQPPLEAPQPVSIRLLVNDALAVARREMARQDVKVNIEMDPTLGTVTGVVNQLHLAFLCVILRVADLLGNIGGGEFQMRVIDQGETVAFEFAAGTVEVDWVASSAESEGSPEHVPLEEIIGLSMARDVIEAHGGSLTVEQCEQETCMRITLPQERFQVL